MKLIRPNYEILTPIDGEYILKTLEKVARTCYKSEDKITDESAKTLVQKLINSGHEAMIEFFDFTVKFVCDRGVSHEIVRHRLASYAQESTRYVSSTEKRNISEFDCDNISDIISAYQQGFSIREISENSCNTEWEIRKILIENNVQIRGLNNKGNRIEDYFSKIDTPEKAYLLGLIQTDGNIKVNNNKSSLTITQHKDYAWYIKDMLLNFSDYIGDSSDRSAQQLQIGSKNIVNDLINIGIVPNKTKLQTIENTEALWMSIPDEFKNSFIRGMIDGDGWVKYYVQKKVLMKVVILDCVLLIIIYLL